MFYVRQNYLAYARTLGFHSTVEPIRKIPSSITHNALFGTQFNIHSPTLLRSLNGRVNKENTFRCKNCCYCQIKKDKEYDRISLLFGVLAGIGVLGGIEWISNKFSQY